MKITLQKIGKYMWIWTANKFAKFHAKRLDRSENITKSFRGLLFETPCIYQQDYGKWLWNMYVIMKLSEVIGSGCWIMPCLPHSHISMSPPELS